MASFFDTVMARSPLLFARCKEVGVPTVIADYSGHGNDMDVVAGTIIFGQGSGVETDPDAKSVYIPGGFANNIGEIDTPPAELLFTGNFAIACFSRQQLSFGSQYLMGRGGIANSGTRGIHFNTIGSDTRILSGTIVTTDGATNTSHNVLGTIDHLLDVHNFHVFIRNGTVLRLYTNAQLVGETTGVSTDPLLISSSNRLVFGAAGNNLAPMKGWASELIICDFAWTEADVVEIYESAINSLFLRAESIVVPTAVLYSDLDPEPVSFPFRHNWSEPLIERIAFRTSVSQARTGAEEAIAQRPVPRREFEFVQLLRNNTERRKFRAQLWRNQHGLWFVPVRQDAEQLDTSLTAGSTLIPASTLFKDYEVGGYVGLRQMDDAGNVLHSEEQVIVSLSGGVEVAGLTYDYDARTSWVYPVRCARIDASLTVNGHTDAIEESRVTFRLLPQDEALTPNRITIWHPTIKYRDYEVYDPAVWPGHNWEEQREYGVERRMDEVDFETGMATWESDTIGAAETIPYSLLLEGRARIAQFLGWLYERQGQRAYLWVATTQSDFDVLGVSGAQLTVADTNYSDAYALAEPRRDLAFVYMDNTMEFRRVTGFSGVTNETLTLDAPVPSLSNLRCVSLLKFCRLDADQVELAWHTDDKVVVAFRFRELLFTPAGTGRSSLSPSASQSVSLSPSGSASPSRSVSPSVSPSASISPSASLSPSSSASVSVSPSVSPSSSVSASTSPSNSASPSV